MVFPLSGMHSPLPNAALGTQLVRIYSILGVGHLILVPCHSVAAELAFQTTQRLMRGMDPAGILRIASKTCLGIGQGGIGAIAGSSHID